MEDLNGVMLGQAIALGQHSGPRPVPLPAEEGVPTATGMPFPALVLYEDLSRAKLKLTMDDYPFPRFEMLPMHREWRYSPSDGGEHLPPQRHWYSPDPIPKPPPGPGPGDTPEGPSIFNRDPAARFPKAKRAGRGAQRAVDILRARRWQGIRGASQMGNQVHPLTDANGVVLGQAIPI